MSFALEKNDYSVKVGADIDSKFGVLQQKDEFKSDLVNKNLYNKAGLANSASLKFNLDKSNSDDLSYGGYIKLNANTSVTASESSNIANEIKLYSQGNFGKIELGNMSSASHSMEVNSYSIARATGGLDGDWRDWLVNGGVISSDNNVINDVFLTAPQLPMSFDESSKAGKVNYFFPEIDGLRLGISYVPDSKAKGTIGQTKRVFKDTDGGYKNVLQPIIRYKKDFGNNVSFTTAVVGEFGKAKKITYEGPSGTDPDINVKTNQERKNLAAWQLGASLSYKKFSVVASYGDIGKSGAIKDSVSDAKYGRTYLSLGSAYSTEKYGISINYMRSNSAGKIASGDVNKYYGDKQYNKFSAVSVGADYEVVPGFIPYVEVTKFNFRKNENFGLDAKFNSGSVLFAGTKIKF